MRVLRQDTDWAALQVRGLVWLALPKTVSTKETWYGAGIFGQICMFGLYVTLFCWRIKQLCLHSDTRTESKREGVREPLEASGLSMADLLAFFHP